MPGVTEEWPQVSDLNRQIHTIENTRPEIVLDSNGSVMIPAPDTMVRTATVAGIHIGMRSLNIATATTAVTMATAGRAGNNSVDIVTALDRRQLEQQ